MGRRSRFSSAVLLALCLLVVSALGIGLARSARLSAQQACFGNLQRLAHATLMYVADNDGRFPPHETRLAPYSCRWGADNSNPWLRWPVLLDPYVQDRSIYLCKGVEVPPVGHSVAIRPGLITTTRITTKGWPNGPCAGVYPPGWGGSITDSAAQKNAYDPARFRATVGAAIFALGDRKLSSIRNPQRTVVWADSSRMYLNLGAMLYANACRVDCADLKGKADWENCSWSRTCGAAPPFTADAKLRSKFTRHNGGSNIAFVDGHVEWLSVPQMIRAYQKGNLAGVAPAGATKGKPWYLRKK